MPRELATTQTKLLHTIATAQGPTHQVLQSLATTPQAHHARVLRAAAQGQTPLAAHAQARRSQAAATTHPAHARVHRAAAQG